MTLIAPTVKEIKLAEDRVQQGLQNVNAVRQKLKTQQEIYRDGLENDAEYSEIKAEMVEVRKRLNARKKELEAGALERVKQEIKDLKAEVKEEQLTLSDWLVDYERETGSRTIELEGTMLSIKHSAKLVKEG